MAGINGFADRNYLRMLLQLFNVSPETAASARFVLYTISAVFIIRSLDIMFIVGIFRGGDTRTAC